MMPSKRQQPIESAQDQDPAVRAWYRDSFAEMGPARLWLSTAAFGRRKKGEEGSRGSRPRRSSTRTELVVSNIADLDLAHMFDSDDDDVAGVL